jgi:hypothetical protein
MIDQNNIYDLGYSKFLIKEDSFYNELARVNNKITDGTNPANILSGDLCGQMTVVAGFIQSANFVSGSAGWQIDYLGNAEFNDGTFRGALTASTIDIGGSDSTSFHVDINGNIWSGAATFNQSTNPFSVSNAGNLSVVGGAISGATITGSLIRSAASGARIEMTDSGILAVYNATQSVIYMDSDAGSGSGFYTGYASGDRKAIDLFADSGVATTADILYIQAGSTSGSAIHITGSGNTNNDLVYIEAGSGAKNLLRLENASTGGGSGYTLLRLNGLDLDKTEALFTNNTSQTPDNVGMVEITESSSGLIPLAVQAMGATCLLLDCDSNSTPSHLRLSNKYGNPDSPVEGDIWYDSTSHTLKYRDNTTTRTVAVV